MGRKAKKNCLLQLVFSWLLLPFLVFVGCENSPTDEALLLTLFQQEKALKCELSLMKDSIVTEWDNINALLKSVLPPDMPPQEQANMLKVRNANLIRMFQSFDSLDESVKMALTKTEKIDAEMTKRITSLKQEVNHIETQKIALLEKVNQSEGVEEVARLKQMNARLLAGACD